MTITATPYYQVSQHLGLGKLNFLTDTLKCALVTNAYTPDLDNHTTWANVSTHDSGITPATLTGVTYAYDVVTHTSTLKAANVTFGSITGVFKYAVVYRNSSPTADSPLICLVTLGDQTVDALTFVLPWATTGLFQLGVTV
jgi:hypothetical protein